MATAYQVGKQGECERGRSTEKYLECVKAAKDLLHHLTALEKQERLVSDAYTNTLRRALDEAVQDALA